MTVPRTIADALRDGERLLADVGLPTPLLDCQLLLESACALTRAQLMTRASDVLTSEQDRTFQKQLAERASGRPIAYIIGEWEFYSLRLKVSDAVLVPRPETELLIDWAKELHRAQPIQSAIDVGTGSGCIAVTLATELGCRVVATELSEPALAVARENVELHGLHERVELLHVDLLPPPIAVDLIVSNPPYVQPGDPTLADDVRRFEPDAALHDRLDGDGLGYYRRLAERAGSYLTANGQLLVEVGDTQADDVAGLFGAAGWQTEVRADLAGIRRAVRCAASPNEA